MANIVRKIEYVIERSFDAMTGFMNRSGFEDQLEELCRDLDPSDEAHQLIYFDLDNLQLVNDTFGRAAGDAVILRFARLLEEDLSRRAVVSRLTGDDFGWVPALVPGIDDVGGTVTAEIMADGAPSALLLQAISTSSSA